MKNKKKGPSKRWAPLRDITAECADEFLDALNAREAGELLEVWQSKLYEVYVFNVMVPEWPHGYVTWLSIKRRDKASVHDWRHLQRIKNEICGPTREGMEMYPSESRLVDTSNQYHLWVLPEGQRFPFGYEGRAVVKADASEDRYVENAARQRPFESGLEPDDAVTFREADEQIRKGLK